MAKQLVSTGQYTLVDVGDYTSTGVLPPINPVANQSIWIDTSQTPPIQKIWNGTAWVVVNEVLLGGRNLVSNGDFERGLEKWDATNATVFDITEYLSMYHKLDSYDTIDETGTKQVAFVGQPPITAWERGSAMSFTMENYITFGLQMPMTLNISLGAWVKFSPAVSGTQGIIGRNGAATAGRYGLYITNSALVAYFRSNVAEQVSFSIPAFRDGKFHHVAMVVDRVNNRLSLYIDFIERAFKIMTGNANNYVLNSDFYVGVFGSNPPTDNSFFRGEISQVFHSEEALTVEQLQDVANAY